MSLADVIGVLARERYSSAHDFDVGADCIKMLGLYESELALLMRKLPGWRAEVRRKGGISDDWLRVDIVRDS